MDRRQLLRCEGLPSLAHAGGERQRVAAGLLGEFPIGPARLAGHLVEAGGDCALAGPSPDGGPWRIGVEDPFGGDQPVAVLELHDTAVATSSLRKRTWQLDGRQVHHLIDPRSGACVDGGLRSVTVLDTDAARAEVWSKALLVAGRRHIAELATEKALPALWVDDSGRLAATPELHETIIWSCRDVH